jgi:hypothetical protein
MRPSRLTLAKTELSAKRRSKMLSENLGGLPPGAQSGFRKRVFKAIASTGPDGRHQMKLYKAIIDCAFGAPDSIAVSCHPNGQI